VKPVTVGDVLGEFDGRPLFAFTGFCKYCEADRRHHTYAVEDANGEHEAERCWTCGRVGRIATLRRSPAAIEREKMHRFLKVS